MNAPVEAQASNLEKLQLQAAQESRWFSTNMQDRMASGQVTTGSLLKKIETMFLQYVKTTWVPDTLSALTDEKLRLEARNAGLGLPAAHGHTGDTPQVDGVLRTLQQAACASIKSVLQQVLPGITELFAQSIKQLDQQMFRALTNSKATDIAGVDLHLAGIKTAVLRVYADANVGVDAALVQELQDALQEHFSKWRVGQRVVTNRTLAASSDTEPNRHKPLRKWEVGTVLKVHSNDSLAVRFPNHDWTVRTTSVHPVHARYSGPARTAFLDGLVCRHDDSKEFKLYRFPQLLSAVISQAEILLSTCAADSDALAKATISENLRFGSPGVNIKHSYQSQPITATVTLTNREKVVGDLVQAFAAKRIDVLHEQLPKCVDQIVKATITSSTTDTCNEERLDILEQINHVEEAIGGIKKIAGK